MSWLETLRTGLDAVLSHRLRSGLTMLGILIGIAAVILTVGFGEGAQAQVSGEINALGSNLLVVSPGSATASTGIRGGFGSASTLTQADATALASKTVAPDIAAVAAATQRSETLTATGTNWTTTVVGTTPDWLSVRARTVTEGRFLTAADENTDAAVAVLGATTAQELFGFRDPVGQTVTVNGLPLTVIGVLNTVGASASSSTTNLDDQAVVPITTVANRIFGGSTRTSVQSIYIEATSSGTLSAAYQEATAELLRLHGVSAARRRLHHLEPAVTADHRHLGGQDADRTAGRHRRHLAPGRRDRRHEHHAGLGHRADPRDRAAQGARGDAAGHPPPVPGRGQRARPGRRDARRGLGLAGAVVLPHLISNPITISPTAAVGAIVVAVGIGIVFGVYPATRAARLAPIDALRSE